MKSEPEAYGIDDLRREGSTLWDGIRNYQARNFMRSMAIGDQAFFYHSNCKPPGIIGLMEVEEIGLVDPTQFDPDAKYYDPKSNRDKPRWDCARLRFLGEFPQLLSLALVCGIAVAHEYLCHGRVGSLQKELCVGLQGHVAGRDRDRPHGFCLSKP